VSSPLDSPASSPASGAADAAIATLQIAGQDLLLLPEKAALLPATSTLLIADAHIGKATSFRQLGVPVPSGTTAATLAALDALVERHAVRRVVFLGDFLHSARAHAASTMNEVAAWRERRASLELVLVRGNHDDHAGDPPAALRIEALDEPLMHGEIALCHEPQALHGAFVLAGHLHPCIGLGGQAHDWHRLPCFWFTAQFGVLPAFGAFTGMHTIRPSHGERVFAAVPERVFEVRLRR
jgi:DNA ligase-associated metallophosphoesterase